MIQNASFVFDIFFRKFFLIIHIYVISNSYLLIMDEQQ